MPSARHARRRVPSFGRYTPAAGLILFNIALRYWHFDDNGRDYTRSGHDFAILFLPRFRADYLRRLHGICTPLISLRRDVSSRDNRVSIFAGRLAISRTFMPLDTAFCQDISRFI